MSVWGQMSNQPVTATGGFFGRWKKLSGRLRSGRGETVNRDNEMMYSILYKFGGQMVQLAPNI